MKNVVIAILFILAATFGIYGVIESEWYLTAITIGYIFGFFLQKGDLCASSAMSEAIMFKDRSKLWGFWIAIVTTMAAISIIDHVGLITANPKPFLWLSSIVGGLIFGSGMVLAGGCISGVLYKGGTGNINSIMALMGVPFGIAAVEFGPLNELHLWMKSFIVKGTNGESLTLYSVTGIPYIILAAVILALTIIYLLMMRKKFRFAVPLKKSWKPWIAGIGIGVLGAVAFLSSSASGRNYPLGVTHGVLQYSLIATEKSENLQFITEKPQKFKPAGTSPRDYSKENIKTINKSAIAKKKVNVWLVLLVLSLVAGAWTSGALSGQSKILPKDPHQTL
ncbi:MAG: YeeE/YedE family protein, partial [Candidatus Kapaibacterium sp.]